MISTDTSFDTEKQASKIKVLSGKEEIIVSNTSIVPVNDPEPSEILQHPQNADRKVMLDITSQHKIKELWEIPDSDFITDERLFLHLHKTICHAPKKYIRRSARRGCFPTELDTLSIMMLYATCVSVDASKRNWTYKGGAVSIRNTNDKRGIKTPCNYMISHETGLIPQVTRGLTYQNYARVVMFLDK